MTDLYDADIERSALVDESNRLEAEGGPLEQLEQELGADYVVWNLMPGFAELMDQYAAATGQDPIADYPLHTFPPAETGDVEGVPLIYVAARTDHETGAMDDQDAERAGQAQLTKFMRGEYAAAFDPVSRYVHAPDEHAAAAIATVAGELTAIGDAEDALTDTTLPPFVAYDDGTRLAPDTLRWLDR